MDTNIQDFFDMSKPLKQIHIITACNRNQVRPVEEDTYEDPEPVEAGHDYAVSIKESELQNFLEAYTKTDGAGRSLSNLDEITSHNTEMHERAPDKLAVYKKYDFTRGTVSNLPIHAQKEEILESINASQVTVIEGATGCGKTTQVPQFILDYFQKKKIYCNIVVTQPRKIAAISIAKRVCKERGWNVGELVGYQVGLDANVNADTRLQYVTTGVLLQKLVSEHNMNKYTHVILDEVHERDQDMDFALLVVRKLLRTNSAFVKVILMSATFNTLKFAEYFSIPGTKGLVPAPIIEIKNRSQYKTRIIHLDEIKNIGSVPEHFMEPMFDPKLILTTNKLILAFNELDVRDSKQQTSLDAHKQSVTIGSVLIFLPGIFEIEAVYEELYKQSKLMGYKWHILPLHSSITSEEQQNVFKSAPTGFRKIILSTNIAESSITVPDVKYVIDFCLSKELVTASDSSFGVLQIIWASKANCDQRAGRVGRVADGRIYRMVPRNIYENYFKAECKPEMIRAPLSRLVLLSKMLNMGSPKNVLGLAMDPPDLRNIVKTILHLKEIGGLKMDIQDKNIGIDGDMTLLGNIMAKLPLDVHITKLIFLGYLFGCMDETIIMGAAMSLKSIFSNPFMERMRAYDSKLIWSDGCMSDPISFLNAYRVWKHSRQQNHFSRAPNAEANWAKRFCLQAKVMNEVSALELELQNRLSRMRLFSDKSRNHLIWSEGERKLLYKIVIAGAFYPNYFLRSSHVDEHEALRLLGGRDPYRTVYFTGMDTRQPGELYVKPIKKALHECNQDLKVEFDSSSKVYVTFIPSNNNKSEYYKELNLRSSIPGKIPLAVYKAVKMRQLHMNFNLKVMKHDQSIIMAEERGLSKQNHTMSDINNPTGSLKSSLPGITVKYVTFMISHFIDCGHFWVQPIETISLLEVIKDSLNENDGAHLGRFSVSQKPYIGQICAGIYEGKYYRVRIVDYGNYEGSLKYKLFFVDYGNNSVASLDELRDFGEIREQMMSYPMLAYEVVLAEVRPSEVFDVGASWTKEADTRFSEMTDDKELSGMIYSVVNGVVACTVFLNYKNMNEWLVLQNYGQFCEESFQSKCNYEIRLMANQLKEEQIQIHNLNQEAQVEGQEDIEPPQQVDCKYTLKLHGPHSPLEAQIYPLMQSTISKKAIIDPNSVNSVLLTPTPQYGSETLIVAAEVAQGQENQNVILRNTTIMPNIDGLPALMAMLFCPKMKLFVNEKWSRYTQILCGLGCDEEGKPLFKEHDMLLSLNTIIENDDIKNINRIRCFMNRMITFPPQILDTPQVLQDNLNLSGTIKDSLKNLWSKNRLIVDNNSNVILDKGWKLTTEYKKNQMRLPIDDEKTAQVYPVHKVLKLKREIQENVEGLLKNNKYLEELCQQSKFVDDAVCKICDVHLDSMFLIKVHMHSRSHKELVHNLKCSKM